MDFRFYKFDKVEIIFCKLILQDKKFTNHQAFFVCTALPSEAEKITCPRCGKGYFRHQMFTHVRFECGKQSVFHCPLCPRKCKTDDILKLHLRNIHRIG
nr:unnamed protein product [Callosobruchus analis]